MSRRASCSFSKLGNVELFFRELKIGIAIGCCFGLIVMLSLFCMHFSQEWQKDVALGIAVGVAMCINMAMATVIGTITPFLLKKINVDPAIASGPVIATSIDVIGLAIYFTLVTSALRWLV